MSEDEVDGVVKGFKPIKGLMLERPPLPQSHKCPIAGFGLLNSLKCHTAPWLSRSYIPLLLTIPLFYFKKE